MNETAIVRVISLLGMQLNRKYNNYFTIITVVKV